MPNDSRHSFYIETHLSENIAVTPEGYRLCIAVPVTRTGEFIYRTDEVPVEAGPDGMVKILREDEEVFREETLRSLEGKPFTINHPQGVVEPSNWSELANGLGQNARRGEGEQSDLTLVDILVTTERGISLIDAGIREISCGYDADYIQIEPGLGKQTNIIYNHIALVNQGRAGTRCKIGDKQCTNCGECGCNKDKQIIKEEEMKKTSFKDSIKSLKKLLISFKDEDIEELEKKAEEKKVKDAEELPVKLKEIRDTWDRWAKDVEEGKLDVSQLPVELKDIPIKDAEEETEAEKKAKEIEASDKKAKDKKAKDQEEEGESDLEELKEQIAELTEVVQELVEDKIKDAKAKDEGEKVKAEKEKEEEKAEVADSWPEICHRVEVLSPGLRLKMPTKDHVKTARQTKIDALKAALVRDEVRDLVIPFIPLDADFSKMTNDAVHVAFIGASELVSRLNNSRVQSSSVSPTRDNSAVTVRSINEKNKAYYKR